LSTGTDSFVSEFTKDKTLYSSIKGKFIAAGVLPADVDQNDQRVQAIIRECKQRHNGKTK
jgi:hypothetical protein